jgi:hypothetical protein
VIVGGCTDGPGITTTTGANQQAVSANPAEVPATYLRTAKVIQARQAPNLAPLGPMLAAKKRDVPTNDTLINFSGQFTSPGFDSDGNPRSVWPYTMVGRDPALNRTTNFRTPIIPVNVELLDATGAVGKTATGAPLRMVSDTGTQQLVLNSPIFQNFPWTNGNTQIGDGMMRAMFFHAIGDKDGDRDDQNYHTVLQPVVKRTQTMRLPAGSYQFAPKADGTCCAFVLADVTAFVTQLFPPTADDTATVIGAAEHAGDMRTTDINTLLFRDVYLTQGRSCCILGFHSVDAEPGDARNGNREKDFVFNFASYISDGLFGGGFSDVTALSHEVSELFADPFINNDTPWWLSIDPNNPNSALCQNNLETGDVVEVLSANATHATPMHNRTYHPSNEALLQWFAFESPSSSRLGAFSFPDETAVPALSPGPLLPGCAPAE